MSPAKRHQRILEKLRLEGQVRVRELAAEFQVTEDCIRKDLTLLAEQKKLQRIHGGAIPNRENPHALKVDDRLNLHEAEKKLIARKALEQIVPGMTVFLDISTINLELARLIYESQMEVRVVTNMSGVMKVFSAPSKAELIFLGGTFNHAHDGFTGAMTINQIHRFHFDLAFLGTVGINLLEKTISTYDPQDGLTKQAVLDQSSQAILVSEKEKLFQEGNYIYARPDCFAGWILEGPLDETETRQAKEAGLELIPAVSAVPAEQEEA